MTDGLIGRSEPLIRSPSAVERMGSATDRQQRRQPQQERRSQEEPNKKRRRIYDLLFDEIDQIDTLDGGQKARIKQNIRAQLSSRAPPSAAGPPPVQDEARVAAALLDESATPDPADHDRIVHMAAPTHPHLPPQEVAENAILAMQLRNCLAHRTTTARRVAVYLHLLLTLDGALRPHMVVDV
ncbi:hypothetical protein [Azospirillum soli]|uniref:hypothetical protein n=1 Tax=Azospirillum soli TaxID=1304799 RepID=UPI001AEAA24D|nr:hypothetical protein [Azospirillum soli]MBP2313966.1 hypothetical protein [Azospirillum soli]